MPDISVNEKSRRNTYDSITINGSATYDKEFIASKIKVNGALKCNSPIKCEYLECNGTMKFFSDIDVNDLNCDGSMLSKGTNCINISQIYCSGAAKISSDITTKIIDINGSFNIVEGGNLTAEKVFCDGSIIVNGNIDADMINSDGFIYAHKITAKKVYIKTKNEMIPKKILTHNINFGIQEIIADEIELVDVKVSKVTGNNIIIGEKCRIDCIECNGTLHISKDASVYEITGNYIEK